MIFDSLDRLTFTAASGQVVVPDSSGNKIGATVTSTNYSDWFPLVAGGVGYTQPMYLVVRYSAAQNASGANNVTFVAQKSSDGSTPFDLSGGAPVTNVTGTKDTIALSTTPQASVVNIPVETRDNWIRLATVVTGSGSTPTITILSCDLNVSPL